MKTLHADPHAWDAWTDATHYRIDDGPWIELATPRAPYIGRHRS